MGAGVMELMRALLSTEITKLKHTSTLWLSVIFPTIVLILQFIALLDQYSRGIPLPARLVAAEWEIGLRQPWMVWTVAIMPILISLEAVGLVSAEHAGKHWKQLYALPIRRWSIFAAKTAVCAILTGVSLLLFSAGVLGLELLRSGLFHLHMASAIPWGLILRISGGAYLASAALIAVQVWLSMRFAGFAIPVGVALASTIAVGVFRLLDLAAWWPWTMPADSLPFEMHHVPASIIVSPVAFAVLVMLAGWRLSRREVVQ
jgi:hypothetical protein